MAAEADGLAVGFVGLGLMGAPTAARLYRAGHPLTVYNRTAAKAEAFAAAAGQAEQDFSALLVWLEGQTGTPVRAPA